MAIKHIITRGIGLSPGSVKYIPTRGFLAVGAAIDRPCLTMTLQTGRLGMMLFGPPRVTMTLQTGTVTMTQVGCDDILT